jgi:hypothetical protein
MSASQIVAMPCSGTASTRMEIVSRVEIDGDIPLGLRQRKERIRHQVLGIARRQIARKGAKQVELIALRMAPPACKGFAVRYGSAPLLACIRNGRVSFGRQHHAGAGIAGRRLGVPISPGLEIIERIDDAAA